MYIQKSQSIVSVPAQSKRGDVASTLETRLRTSEAPDSQPELSICFRSSERAPSGHGVCRRWGGGHPYTHLQELQRAASPNVMPFLGRPASEI